MFEIVFLHINLMQKTNFTSSLTVIYSKNKINLEIKVNFEIFIVILITICNYDDNETLRCRLPVASHIINNRQFHSTKEACTSFLALGCTC